MAATDAEEDEEEGKRSPRQSTQVNGPCFVLIEIIFVSKPLRLPAFAPTIRLH
jgi:hypothetical protein